jgi:ABC-type transport system substrate-binding protein
MRRKTTLFVLAFMVCAMAVSVVPAVSAQDEQTYPFIYGALSSPAGVDPLGVYDTTSALILYQVCETLYGFDYTDPSMPSVPLLASKMGTWNTAQTELTVELREGVTWQNGEPFTAEDVKWNFDRLNTLSRSHDCEHASLWFNDEWDNEEDEIQQLILNKTEVVDTHTVKFTLNKKWGDFDALLPFSGIGMIYPTAGFNDTLMDFEDIDLVIGTGPFTLDYITINEKTVLNKYTDYWGGQADFKQVIVQCFDGTDSMEQALYNEEVHAVRSIGVEATDTVERDADLDYKKVKTSCCFGFHLGWQPMDDNSLSPMGMPWHARKAVQFAFNYTYWLEEVQQGAEYEIHTPVPEGMFGHNPDVPGLPYYDLEKARGFLLMEGSPYKATLDAIPLTATSPDADWIELAETAPLDVFNFTCYSSVAGVATLLDAFMAFCGMNVELNNRGDWSTFLDYCQDNENLGIVMLGWCPDYFAAVNQIEPLFAKTGSANYNQMDNATVDAAMAELHTIPQGNILQNAIDEVVSMVIVENAVGMYTSQSAEFIAWSNWWLETGSMDEWWNSQADKPFFELRWNRLNVPTAYYGDPDEAEEPFIPGYSVGIMMAIGIAASVILMLRKRK